MASGDARIVITVDATGAVTAVRDFDKALQDTKGSADSASSGFGSLWQQFALGELAINAAYRAFTLLKREFEDSIKEAADYEKAAKGLNAAFDISGRTMPGMVEHLKDYAERLREVGLADDAELIRAEALTMQLTQLDEKGIKAVTRGAIGLADVFGYDLQSAVEMLSRGMEGQYFALNRLFPAIRNAVGESEKHAALLRIMEGLYGRAIADLDTYAGQMKKLGIEYGEMKKHLGEAILSSGILQGTMEGLALAISKVEQFLGKQTQSEIDHNQAEMEALDILQKVAEATNRQNSWIQEQTSRYHENYEALLEDVRAGALGRKEQLAAEVAVRAHNAAIDAQGKVFTETGKIVVSYDEKLRAMYIAAHAHARALLDESVALTLIAGKLPEAGLKFFMADQATAEERRIREVASRIVLDIQGVSSATKEVNQIWNTALGSMLAQAIQFGSGTGSVLSQVGQNFVKMAETAIAAQEMMAFKYLTSAREQIAADKSRSLSALIASIFESVPFPLDIILAAGAFATINALFAKIFKFAGGFEGIVRQPTLFLAGEAGPERVSVRNQTQMNNGTSTINVAIYSSGVVDGNKVWKEIEYQARRRGVKIGRA